MITVTLRNYQTGELLPYYIKPADTQLAHDWQQALENDILKKHRHLEKNYCFHGFPYTQRNLNFLCEQLNKYIYQINVFNSQQGWTSHGLESYVIDEWFAPDVVRFSDAYEIGACADSKSFYQKLGLRLRHETMNRLHNHFERLQGTVEKPSKYFLVATPEIRYAIRQLNNLCHEIETLVLSQRKLAYQPEWVRPSQITTFFGAQRYNLTEEHRVGFTENGYDREFGGVYMHWCQIGKTLMEVFRDEGDILLDNNPVCEAITHLQYYSGEFDIEWAKSVTRKEDFHQKEISDFRAWLAKNNIDFTDTQYSLGYLKIGQVDLQQSFGTEDPQTVWKMLENYLDIYSISINSTTVVYDYHWSNSDYTEQQMEKLK